MVLQNPVVRAPKRAERLEERNGRTLGRFWIHDFHEQRVNESWKNFNRACCQIILPIQTLSYGQDLLLETCFPLWIVTPVLLVDEGGQKMLECCLCRRLTTSTRFESVDGKKLGGGGKILDNLKNFEKKRKKKKEKRKKKQCVCQRKVWFHKKKKNTKTHREW